MTHRSDSLRKTPRFLMLASVAVASALMALATASAQQERRSDRTSGRDDSTQSRDQSSQRDQLGQSQNFDRTGQDRSGRTQQGQAYQGQPYQGQQNQGQQYQGQQYQGQSGQRQQATDRSASSDRSQSRDQGRRGTQESGDVAWLGVFLQDSEGNQSGAQIAQIYPGGPAARAGLRPGDIISEVNGQKVGSSSELIGAIEQEQPGARAQFVVTRNNQQVNLPVTLGSRESFTWRGQSDDQWSGQGGQYSGGQNTSGQSNQYGRGSQSGQTDYFANVPPFAMQLEHERRMYEQHQRIETEITKLQEEVRQLRELIQQQQRR